MLAGTSNSNFHPVSEKEKIGTRAVEALLLDRERTWTGF